MNINFTLGEEVGKASSDARAEAIASLVTKFAPRRVSALNKGRSVYIQYDPGKGYYADHEHVGTWIKNDTQHYEMATSGTIEYAKSLLQADRDDLKVQQILEEMILKESEKVNG